MRAIVLGNRMGMDAGFVGNHLRGHGFRFEEAHREDLAHRPDLDGADLVLTLGSEWNVYRPETAAAVDAEAALVREVIERGVPLLAICFGAQVLAHALGGTVRRSPTPEIGWFDLDVAPGAPTPSMTGPRMAGPSMAGPWMAGPWMEWHDDVFTVPEGFDVLARTDAGPQVIAGGRAVGTQFHPEATETMVRDWIEHGGAEQLTSRGGDPDALLAETRAHVARSRPAAEALVDWFLDVTAGP